jgi:hypothetical protein
MSSPVTVHNTYLSEDRQACRWMWITMQKGVRTERADRQELNVKAFNTALLGTPPGLGGRAKQPPTPQRSSNNNSAKTYKEWQSFMSIRRQKLP